MKLSITSSLLAFVFVILCVIGIINNDIHEVQIYNNGIFSLEDSEKYGQYISYDDISAIKSIFEKSHFVRKVDVYRYSSGIIKLYIYSNTLLFKIIAADGKVHFLNEHKTLVKETEGYTYNYDIPMVFFAKSYSTDNQSNDKLIAKHYVDALIDIHEYCNFDRISNVKFLDLYDRVDISFAKLAVFRASVANIRRGCKLLHKFYKSKNIKLDTVEYVDGRLNNNLIFKRYG